MKTSTVTGSSSTSNLEPTPAELEAGACLPEEPEPQAELMRIAGLAGPKRMGAFGRTGGGNRVQSLLVPTNQLGSERRFMVPRKRQQSSAPRHPAVAATLGQRPGGRRVRR